MTEETKIWEAALRMIDMFGDDADIHAALRADHFLDLIPAIVFIEPCNHAGW
jgi:hypothetical protein